MGWKLTWEFSNHHIWHQIFLTEAEALAFVERSIEGDPNVLHWEGIPYEPQCF